MTDYPIVRFVSGLSSDASTRFDFHELGVSSTDPAAWVWTPGGLLGDPDSINPDYGFGRLDFELQVHTSHADAVRIMAALARELRRSSNFLLFEFDAYTSPAWLEVFPSSPGALGFPYAKPGTDDSVWVIPVSLTTGATWIGEQVSHSVTVANDPAVGGLSAVLPEIVGDAPATLVVEIAPTTATYIQPFLSVAPLDATWPGTVFSQAETWTLGADATVASSASESGGSLVVWTESGAVTQRLMTTQFQVPFAGRWRLFARAAAVPDFGTAPDLVMWGTGDAVAEPVTTVMNTTGRRYVDLGIYVFPKGNQPSSRPYTIGAGEVGIDITNRLSGAYLATLHVDFVIAVPLDLPLDQLQPPASLTFPPLTQNSGTARFVLNGEAGRAEQLTNAGTTHDPAAVDQPTGSWPVVVPGAANVMHLLERYRNTGDYYSPISGSRTLTVKYRPRHVYLPGS